MDVPSVIPRPCPWASPQRAVDEARANYDKFKDTELEKRDADTKALTEFIVNAAKAAALNGHKEYRVFDNTWNTREVQAWNNSDVYVRVIANLEKEGFKVEIVERSMPRLSKHLVVSGWAE